MNRKLPWTFVVLAAAVLMCGCGRTPTAHADAVHAKQDTPSANVVQFVKNPDAAPDFQLNDLDGKPVSLAEAKGKQKPDQYVIHEGEKKTTLTPQEFREKARDYLSQLVNDYPQSRFKDEALEDLKSLGGAKPKESKP